MGLIEYYAIFAIATALLSLIDIFMPVMKTAINDGVLNDFTYNPKLSYFIYFCINLIIAPIVIIPLTVPSFNIRMYKKMLEAVSAEDN